MLWWYKEYKYYLSRQTHLSWRSIILKGKEEHNIRQQDVGIFLRVSSLSSRKTITKTCLKYVIKIYGLLLQYFMQRRVERRRNMISMSHDKFLHLTLLYSYTLKTLKRSHFNCIKGRGSSGSAQMGSLVTFHVYIKSSDS